MVLNIDFRAQLIIPDTSCLDVGHVATLWKLNRKLFFPQCVRKPHAFVMSLITAKNPTWADKRSSLLHTHSQYQNVTLVITTGNLPNLCWTSSVINGFQRHLSTVVGVRWPDLYDLLEIIVCREEIVHPFSIIYLNPNDNDCFFLSAFTSFACCVL